MRSTVTTSTSSFMTFLLSLVPIFKSCPPCPVCMPQYAAIFAFFGLELADYSHFLIPMMLCLMLLSLGSMYTQIRKNHLSYQPLIAAIAASAMLLVSKYILDNTWLTYITMLSLITATIWHNRLNKNICNTLQAAEKKCCN